MKSLSPRNLQSLVLLLIVAGVLLLALGGFLAPVLRVASDPLVAIQSWISTRFSALYEFLTVPRDVATLREQNALLESQVASLQSQVIQMQEQLTEADVLYSLLDFARANPQYDYSAAQVIGQDPSPYLQYVYINVGSDDGIRHGMPVVTSQGLVGRIDAVSARGARVQLITDAGSAVNVKIQSSQVNAMLVGSLTGDVSLEMVTQETNLNNGDIILTSGLSTSYPSDILVGQIVSVRKQENDLYQTASVQPAVDFKTLQAVLVITNFKPVDLTPIEPTPSS